jgi:hypothetical protein
MIKGLEEGGGVLWILWGLSSKAKGRVLLMLKGKKNSF